MKAFVGLAMVARTRRLPWVAPLCLVHSRSVRERTRAIAVHGRASEGSNYARTHSSLRRPSEQPIERLNCRGHAAGGGRQRAAELLEPGNCVDLRDSPRETLANLSITGHLRCFSDQPVAEIVQCGEPARKINKINNLYAKATSAPLSAYFPASAPVQAALDDFRNSLVSTKPPP